MLYSIGKEKEEQDETKLLYYGVQLSLFGGFKIMFVSYNQLAGWNSHAKEGLQFNEQEAKINDYYECLIECEDDTSSCKRICKEVLL